MTDVALRWRLTLLVIMVAGITVLLSWAAVQRAALRPLERDLMRQHARTALRIANRVEAGANPNRLSDDLGVEVKVRPSPPAENPRRKGWVHKQMGGRKLWIRGGPEPVAAVDTKLGWVMVRRDVDLAGPSRRLAAWLGLLLVVVAALAVWTSALVLRPLEDTRKAMHRMASGDLTHRLDEHGPPELVQAARAFNGMANRIQDMLRTQQELMAGISHELRTPLARLRLETEMLRDRGVPDRRIVAMEGDLAELDGLVGDVLEISRLELGTGLGPLQAVDLAEVAAEAVRRWPTPDHSVTVAGQAEPVQADPKRLLRVFGNLIQNAGKYAPAGTAISILLDGTAFRVRDEGAGVSPGELERLFTPFYRGTKSSTHQGKGLGLGLMLVRQIVEAHGGTVTARNRKEGGLEIEVRLTGA